jgi:ribonucleoside-diphosphate reductase alpha chain
MPKPKGLTFQRHFTKDIPRGRVYEAIEWEHRDVALLNQTAKLIATEQKAVEVPKAWSDRALTIVVDKYFRGQYNTPERETSVWQMVCRVADTIVGHGRKAGYFATANDAVNFADELKYLLVTQRLCFNSPVWFNVGWDDEPQVSACFLLDVEDDMEDILEWFRTEIDIFRGGSGAGICGDKLRSKHEGLSGGGVSSGMMSFNRVADNAAAVVQSGGKTRRAARMFQSGADHPEILDFIWCKAKEEEKLLALRAAGFDVSWGSEVVELAQWQNANLTMKVTDEFMTRATEESDQFDNWSTYYRVSGQVASMHNASKLLDDACKAAWRSGDPGLAFEDRIQEWHTCPSCGPIRTSNPCGEYLHNTDTSCNLLTLRLMMFLLANNQFDQDGFEAAVATGFIAQDILIGFAGYPHPKIKEETLKHRPIGLNYADLGALLMALGIPYDSDEGRQLAGAITSLMTANAAVTTAQLAKHLGSFDCYEKNRESYNVVMHKHAEATNQLVDRITNQTSLAWVISTRARLQWNSAVAAISVYGARNGQLTLLAPTGTVSFMLDCDSTGVEPLIRLVIFKNLVGGGTLKMVSRVVERALHSLGYSAIEIAKISRQIEEGDAPCQIRDLDSGHYAVFDTAFDQGGRSLSIAAHIDMMIACQPFLSGAISKTVNLPESATPDDFRQAFIRGWKGGLKNIAIYRDNSKATQVLFTEPSKKSEAEVIEKVVFAGSRRKLPATRKSITHKFAINQHEGYLTIGLYDEGTPGELFVTMSKEGTIISGLMDAFATSISLNLQYGVPIDVLIKKFTSTRFEPYGFTENTDIPIATSIVDYIFRFMEQCFVTDQPYTPQAELNPTYETNGNTCPSCGGMLRQIKSNCYECTNCSSGFGGCG